MLKSLGWLSVHDLMSWPVQSQLVARQNAMVASTALVQRRREHDEVDEFLAVLRCPPEMTTGNRAAAAGVEMDS